MLGPLEHEGTVRMSNPRKHHYLSQFYLKGFSADGKGLLQIEKATLNGYGCSIKDAAAIRDYHILDYADAEDPQAFEKALSEYEGALSVALERVLANGIHGERDHVEILSLLALMRFRVPAFKSFVEGAMRGLVRTTGVMMQRNEKLPALPRGLEGHLDMSKVNIEIKNWACLQHMFMLATDSDLMQLMLGMHHSIIRAPEGQSFLTSDQPVALFSPSAKANDAYGVGLASQDVELTFPLSRTQLLKLSWGDGDPHDRTADASEVDELNRRTVVMADGRIFASGDLEELKAFVSRYKAFSAGMQIDAIDAGNAAFHMSMFRPVMRSEVY
jgi:hypothetical protein